MSKAKEKILAFVGGRAVTSSTITALFIGVIIAVNAIVYALTVGYGLYLYNPDTEDLTISGATDELFARIGEGEKVKVMFCRAKNEFDANAANDEVTTFHNTASQFAERYPSLIELEYVNILTKRNSKGELVDLSEYQMVDEKNDVTYPIYESSVIFINEAMGQHRLISDVGSSVFTASSQNASSYTSYNGEEVFAAMVSWVLAKEHKVAYFTTYHGEVADVFFANLLTCAGYSIETIDIRKDNIPENADLLIISNPSKDFEEAVEGSKVVSEMDRLRDFASKGGNLYVALDPYVSKLHNLEAFLEKYGITMSEEEKDGKLIRNIVKDSDNAITTDNFTLVANIEETAYGNEISKILEKYDSGKVILRECAALELSLGAEAIFTTSPASSTYAGGEKTSSLGNYCVGAVAKTKSSDNSKEGNIFVIPTVYLTANDALTTSGYANRDFLYAMFDYVFDAESLPYGCAPVYLNSQTLENLTMKTARLYTFFILLIPVIIAAVGAVVVIKRKHR